jgi:hypothetical protein
VARNQWCFETATEEEKAQSFQDIDSFLFSIVNEGNEEEKLEETIQMWRSDLNPMMVRSLLNVETLLDLALEPANKDSVKKDAEKEDLKKEVLHLTLNSSEKNELEGGPLKEDPSKPTSPKKEGVQDRAE